ncbi:MAG TPA: enoyl-CoA hydratase/isomerase family protein [Chloroflexota bacterium]|nr:enoyl-CoA hydratase/isomerase family protein [Chloroflexota bacterium]
MAVGVEKRGSIGLVKFNRPPANSYNREFLDELNAAIDEIRFDEQVRVAIVVSELPRFFCAGADIKMFQESSLPYKTAFVLHAHEVVAKIERTPKVWIAAISGHTLGGGLEIALGCDFRFAAEGDYRIGLPESKLGLLPGTGGTQRLPRLIGHTRALHLILTGEAVGPQEALDLGIVDRLFAADQLMDECLEYANGLASGAPIALGNIKVAATLGGQGTLESGLALEREAVWRLFPTDDAAEGLAAQTERRAPKFEGH